MATKAKRSTSAPRHPEKKWDPSMEASASPSGSTKSRRRTAPDFFAFVWPTWLCGVHRSSCEKSRVIARRMAT